MKQMPMIEKYMTAAPFIIGNHNSIQTALELMKKNQIRHLPVENGGELIGVLTDRDVKLAISFKGKEELTVNDVMTLHPYSVVPQAPLDQVVFEMAEHKYGCAVIRQENGKVVGIFTATDGVRVLGEILQTHYKPIQN